MDAPVQRRGWWARNWKWFVPTGLVGMFLVCGGCFGGIFFTVFGTMKASDPYKQAVAIAERHPAVVQSLGQPIKPAWYVSGSINVTAKSGDASFEIPISGPNGSGTLMVEAARQGGQWAFSELYVLIDADGARIDLPQSDDAPVP